MVNKSSTLTKKKPRSAGFFVLAEQEGFEPSIRYNRIPDFESGAFDHSATFPLEAHYYIEAFRKIKFFMQALLHALR